MKGFSSRSPTKRKELLLKYLKPGALAQIRDSKMGARSHKSNSYVELSSHRFDSDPTQNLTAQSQISVIDHVPYLLTKIYGPQCPQRKKLVAVKPVSLLNLLPSSPISEFSPPDSINVFSNGGVVAN